jgi:phosphatidylinositol alpha-mannosyltransferase
MALLPDDVHLWVASDGPETEELKRRFASDARIEWLGRIDDAEKYERLRRASLFCAPSLRGESFGVVLLEAMAAGTPVVASDIDGYRNVATDSETAVLVEPGNVQALASSMARVIADSRLSESLVSAGLAHAQSFSMDALAVKYVAMYERALHMEATNITTITVPRMLKRFEGRFLRQSRLNGKK